jgi:hypothetical protein
MRLRQSTIFWTVFGSISSSALDSRPNHISQASFTAAATVADIPLTLGEAANPPLTLRL